MTFSLRGEHLGPKPNQARNPARTPARKSITVLCSLLVALALACLAPAAAAQLQVGQPIDFGSSGVGSPVTLIVVFSASGNTTISSTTVLTDGATGQDFTLNSTTCTGTIAQNTTCNASVTFTPTRVGVRHGVMLLYGSGNQVVSEVFLHGIGSGGAFAFAPANVTALTAAPGLTPATFTSGSSVQDGYGNIYFTDVQNQRILKQSTTGTISLVTALSVSASSSIAIGPDGTLYVSAQNAVYGFLPGATPTPISTGGITLVSPSGLAVDSIGDLYIADASTGSLAKYALNGTGTTTVALASLTPALSSPKGLAVDAGNNLYVADSGNDRVVEVSASTGANTLLVFSGITLNNPTGLTVDPAGTVYVTDTANHRVVELTVNGVAFALTDPNLTLNTPTGVLMKPNGDLVVSDNVLGQVLVPRSIPFVNFPTPTIVGTLDSTDGALPLTLQATGNSVAQLVFPTSGTEPTISTTAFALTSAGTCPSINQGNNFTPLQFNIGDICTYTIDFTPLIVGLNSANFVININLPGGSTTYTTTVPLTGTGISSIASFSLVASPSTTTVGAPVSLTLTALNASNGTATDYTGTVTFTSTDSTGVFLGGTTYTFTTADHGVLSIPAASGIQFNQTGTFTVHATDGTYSATSNQVVVKNATTAGSFTSSVNPSLPNQSTTLSVTLTSAGPQPTGTVSFYSGTTLLGTGTINNGVATITTTFTTPGTYPLTAVYSGDANNAPVTASGLTQTVRNPTTATSFTSSVNPSLPNQNTVLTLTLTAGTGPTPTGTVNFFSGTTQIGTGTLNNGVATLTTSFATVGTYALSAVYTGDTNDAPVTATLNQQVVNAVTITLTSSANPSLVNQQVTLSTTVSSTSSTPTGTVQFLDGTTVLGTATLVNGAATLPATFTTVGTHSLTVVYSGDANNVAATSAVYAQHVVTPTVVSAFTSSVNPSAVGQNTVLSVTLAATGTTPAPTGTVSFYSGTTLLGTGTITNGVATLTTSFPAIGSYSLTAVYPGDNNNAAVTAGPITQVVVAASSVVLTSSINPSLVNQSTILTAFLGSTTATGTVQFLDGSTVLGTATVTNGSASLTHSFTTTGIHSLTAVYSGDANNAAATSAVLAQDVVTPTTVSSFTSSVNPSQVNQSTTLSVTLTGTSGAPTGTVSFYNGTTLLGTGTLNNGTATLPVSFPASGSYPLTAVYSGDNNNAAVTASGLTQVVVAAGSIVLTSTVNPVLVNAATTLTATLGTTTSTGTVSFYNGTTLLGTGTLTNGVATLPITFPTAGLQSLTAVYAGNTSAVYLQDVLNPTTAATFTSSINPSLVNQSTTLTVTLTSASPTLTGTVKFYSGGTTLLGTATVSGGTASIPASFAAPGSYTLTAVYSGDNSNAPVTTAPLTQVVINSTGVTLTSSVNPVLVNASTNLTATLSSATATGTITFFDGTTQIGSGTVSGGHVTVPATFATPGIQNLTAVYSGDANNATATSAVLPEDVQNPDTATVAASPNPAIINQPVTLTATIHFTANGSPTGSVQFFSGTTLLGTGSVSAGTASIQATFTSVGTRSITCQYAGDNFFAAAACPAISLPVQGSSSLALTSSLNPSTFGQSVTLTATITTAGPTPTGSVAFYNGTTLLSTVNLPNGSNVATLTTTTLPIGADGLRAVYSGDANTPTATGTLTQTVLNPATISFPCPTGPLLVNTPFTLTATVTSTGTAPTGTVRFLSGTTLLGTGTLVNGTATISATITTPGTQTLQAVYSGDANNGTVSSTTCSVPAVDAATIALTSSVNPSLVNQSTTLQAVITSAGPTPTGTVTFKSGTAVLGTVNVVNGTASGSYAFPTAGTYQLTAVYSGDANTQAVTSAPLPQVVLNIATIALTSSTNPILLNNPDVLTAVVTSTGVTPTGLVTFYLGTAPLGNATLVNGTATLSTSFPVSGTQNLTAVYYGDPVTAPATSGPVSETVGDIAIAVATGTPSSRSILAGGTTSYSLVLTPLIVSTLPSTVTFSVDGLPTGATATFTPASVTAGNGVTPFIMTINMPAIQARNHNGPLAPATRIAPVAVALVLLPAAFLRRRRLTTLRKKFGGLLLLLLLAAGASALSGCISAASSGYYGQTVQTYNLTVIASSGELSRTTGVTLVVQ